MSSFKLQEHEVSEACDRNRVESGERINALTKTGRRP
jgi:hypothetical protein